MVVTTAGTALCDLEANIRKDPTSYLSDFETQYENYVSLEVTYLSSPSEYVAKLDSLLVFLSQAYLRAFMRLRSKDFITSQQAVDVAFRLHRCQDKQVRKVLRGFIIGDLKRANRKNTSNKSNSVIQSFLAKLINDGNATVAKEAVVLLVELYRRNVWKDETVANLIAEACFVKSNKVYSKAVRFFLGHNEKATENESSSDSDDNVGLDTRIKRLKMGHRVGVKTKKRTKRLDRSIDNLKRKNERKMKGRLPPGINIIALNMIYDPQAFGERLFHKLEKCNDRLEIRLLLLELISHLIGVHHLLLLNFYPSLQRFLRPQQREITRLLLFAAQASHDLVPPDVITPLVRTITDNFVTDRASAEAITVGLNTIREICARCPYAVDADLLSDLIQYKSYRNKNVVAAARSLIRLYRQINPSLLPKREVGRPTEALKEALDGDMDADALLANRGLARVFGKKGVATSIAGAEVLIKVTDSEKPASELAKQNLGVEKDAGKSAKTGSITNKRDGENGSLDTEMGDAELGEEKEAEGAVCEGFENATKGASSSKTGETTQLVRKRLAKSVSPEDILSTRVLTDDDFEAIRRRQSEKQTLFAVTGGRKRKRREGLMIDGEDFNLDCDNDNDEEIRKDANPEEVHGLVSMRNITKLVKRAHSTKADRIDTIAEGREGRKKYGFQVNRMNPHASTTNREKGKKKTFQMIKHKARKKAKRSFRERQVALRDHLKKLSKTLRH